MNDIDRSLTRQTKIFQSILNQQEMSESDESDYEDFSEALNEN